MCRFVFYQGPPLTLASLLTEPSHSLIKQSIASKESEEPLNGDGFGVAWYVHGISDEPAAFRSVTPAWNNMNLLSLARVTRSQTILAHVRAATSGQPVVEFNCHPFTHGRYAFMHNGDIGGFATIRRALLSRPSDHAFNAVKGSTDSEHLFALFLDHARRAGSMLSASEMARALVDTVREISQLQHDAGVTEHNYLNVAVSDGRCSAVMRYTSDVPENASSLHLHTGRRYVCDGGVCRMVEPEAGQGAAMVSSEVLSDDPGWQTVKPNSIVLVGEDRRVQTTMVEW